MVKLMSENSSKSLVRRTGLSRRRVAFASVAVLCAVAGCGEGPKAQFGWRESTENLIPPAKKSVQKVMLESFGTPHELVGWERMPVNYGGVRAEVASAESGRVTLSFADPNAASQVRHNLPMLWLTGVRSEGKAADLVQQFNPKTSEIAWTGKAEPAPAAGDKLLIGFGEQLQLGRVVYMKNCLHCHGVAGDGEGPTARYLNPRPRDFRLGIVKFTSTLAQERASRDDLRRTITYGIPGTYMPSFLLMKEEEKTAVIEYIRWLAMRGEMEKRLGDELADFNAASIKADSKKAKEDYDAAVKAGEKPEKPATEREALAAAAASFATYETEEFPGIIDETADFIADTWRRADDEASVIVPNVARVADTPESRQRGRVLYMSNRTKCYTCHGPQGRGDGGAVEDFWPKPGTNEKYAERGLHDVWGHKLQPRDLTKGQYRGGRRPVDLYRRVFAGIKGTPMPAFGGTVLKDEEIWDLVNYVMSIPFESQTTAPTRPTTMASTTPETERGR